MVPGIGIAAAGLVMFFLLAPSPEAAGFQPEEVVDVVVVDVVDVVDVVVVDVVVVIVVVSGSAVKSNSKRGVKEEFVSVGPVLVTETDVSIFESSTETDISSIFSFGVSVIVTLVVSAVVDNPKSS